ncbi:MAG: glycosyltransferase family 4 protein [Synechococcales bacterium]|nr:glycosyltransferase family 4 protein [Synechococcales bacterium]
MRQQIPILLFSPYTQHLTGGPRVFLNLVERLDQSIFKPICVFHKESEVSQRCGDRGFETVVVPFPAILDIYNEGIFAYSGRDKLRSLKALLDYNTEIKQVGLRYGVRAIWGRNVKSVLLIGLAAHQLQAALIWDIGMEKESRGLVRLFHWLGFALASAVVTEAPSQAATIFDPVLLRLFQRKLVTIAPGIDLDRVAQLVQPQPTDIGQPTFTILSVGTISPRKNQLMLLMALQGLMPAFPQIRLKFVGPIADEDYGKTCQRFAQVIGQGDRVQFLGWRDDIPELMRNSDLFVLCSTNEGIPYAIHEAMHAGLPIIATAVGGVPDALEHGKTGFLVAKNDILDLQRWIEYCLLHPDQRRSLGANARQAARAKFSITEWSAQYNQLFARLCQIQPSFDVLSHYP